MNKAELVNEISKLSRLTKKDCNSCINALTQVVSTSLKRGDNISLTGFGKFEVKNRKSRNSYNPVARRTIRLPASKVPHFKPGKTLKEFVG